MLEAKNLLKKSRIIQITTILFVFLTFWWIIIEPLNKEAFLYQKNIWSTVYFILAVVGGIYGLIISKRFDGRKSLLGKIILAFSIGLFLQAFGQIVYNYYSWFDQIEIPYPSLGDLGYFGSIFAYIYGVFILARYIGATISVRSFLNKILTIIIPAGMLIFSYVILMKGYVFDWSNPVRIFLDFGYPFGEVFYISIAILVFIFSRNFLGGLLKKPILFLLVALGAQYFSDFMFLYQTNNKTWYTGGINEYLYLVSYFLMTLAIIYIGDIFQQIRFESSQIPNVHPETKNDNSLEQLFNQIITEIIKYQIRITGQLAWQEVRKIHEILIFDEVSIKISIVGDPKETIDKLIYGYKNFFGDLAVKVSKNAVYNLITKLPPEEVPNSLR